MRIRTCSLPPVLAAAGIAAAALLAGCEDDYGTACEFPNAPEIRSACGEDADEGTVGTCVYRNSATCSSRICANFIGEPRYPNGFCTITCDLDSTADCPTGDTCVQAPGRTDGYCVPARFYNAAID